MARWWLVLAAVTAVSACDGRGPGRQVLIDRCLRGGADEAQCVCLARETNKRLDDEMFSLVVLAASGEAEEAEDILAAFEPPEQLTYSKLLSEVARLCVASPVS